MDAPYRSAADPALGPPVSVHPWRTGPGWIIGLLLIGLEGYFLSTGYRRPKWETGDTVGLVVMTVVCLGLAWLMISISLRTRGDHATVYEGAISVRRRGQTTTLPWDRIQSIKSDMRRRGVTVRHLHTIEGLSGEKILLTQIHADIEDLVARIQAKVGRVLVARTLEKLSRGEAVDFGPFEIRGSEIVRAGSPEQRLRAADARADVEDGWFHIRPSGSRRLFVTARYAELPNAFVVEDLLERAAALDDAGASS